MTLDDLTPYPAIRERDSANVRPLTPGDDRALRALVAEVVPDVDWPRVRRRLRELRRSRR